MNAKEGIEKYGGYTIVTINFKRPARQKRYTILNNINIMEKKLKHLEFIQNIISRMNSNSFLIKGWAITLFSALFTLANINLATDFIFISQISILLFWLLDGYFLSQEKQYRELYIDVSKKSEDQIDFLMDVSNYNNGKNSWRFSIFSKTTWPLYIVMGTVSLFYLIYN
jgi:hypothetical protein